MAIIGMTELRSALSVGQDLAFYKQAATTRGAGTFHSWWRVRPPFNPDTDTPGTGGGEAVSSATLGALPFTNPGAGNSLYLGRASFNSETSGYFVLYDRLVQTSGLVGNTTDEQTVNSAALTRHTTGEGCQVWLEIYGNAGSGTPTCSVSYTNQAGTAGRTGVTPAWTSVQNAGQMFPVYLQAGDTGVRSVQSVTMSAVTGVAGNFGITILKPIADFVAVAGSTARYNHSAFYDAIAVGFPIIASNACLALMGRVTAQTQNPIAAQFTLIEG